MKEIPLILSRRSFLKTTAAASVALALSKSQFASAQKASITVAQMRASGATAKISILPVRNELRVLMGSGGNILVLPGADGQLAVDSGYATSRNQIAQALSTISGKPLRHLINTHWHYDHTDGNEWMHQAGGTIVAQERTRVRMSSRQEIPAFDAVLPPSPSGALPTVVFAQSHTVAVNGDLIRLLRYTPAHTDTDISVFFTKANVLHTGDTWFNGYYPFIDYNSGGSIKGLLAASKENLALADGRTIVIPGHGGVGSRQNLVEFDEMLMAIHDKVVTLKRSGDSLAAVVAAQPTLQFDAKWGGGFITPELFVDLIYRGI
jgi:glyoxylase-like metal-dependent hydrolase (beta-lactamase superfamily II)